MSTTSAMIGSSFLEVVEVVPAEKAAVTRKRKTSEKAAPSDPDAKRRRLAGPGDGDDGDNGDGMDLEPTHVDIDLEHPAVLDLVKSAVAEAGVRMQARMEKTIAEEVRRAVIDFCDGLVTARASADAETRARAQKATQALLGRKSSTVQIPNGTLQALQHILTPFLSRKGVEQASLACKEFQEMTRTIKRPVSFVIECQDTLVGVFNGGGLFGGSSLFNGGSLFGNHTKCRYQIDTEKLETMLGGANLPGAKRKFYTFRLFLWYYLLFYLCRSPLDVAPVQPMDTAHVKILASRVRKLLMQAAAVAREVHVYTDRLDVLPRHAKDFLGADKKISIAFVERNRITARPGAPKAKDLLKHYRRRGNFIKLAWIQAPRGLLTPLGLPSMDDTPDCFTKIDS